MTAREKKNDNFRNGIIDFLWIALEFPKHISGIKVWRKFGFSHHHEQHSLERIIVQLLSRKQGNILFSARVSFQNH